MMRKFSVVTLHHHPIAMDEAASVIDACDQMRARQAGSVLVTGETGRLVGIFTGRDAVCRVLAQRRDPHTTRLAEVMTPDPKTMLPDRTAVDALRMMAEGGFRHVPLVKNGGIVGLVSRGDFRGLELSPDDEECDLWQHLR
jgi:CBS domain-containing protein